MGGEEDDDDDDGGGGDGEDEGDDDGGDGGSPAADAISAVVSKRPRGDDMRMRKFRHLFFRSLAGVGGAGRAVAGPYSLCGLRSMAAKAAVQISNLIGNQP